MPGTVHNARVAAVRSRGGIGTLVDGLALAGAGLFALLTAWRFRSLVINAWVWLWARLGVTLPLFAGMAGLLVVRSIQHWRRGTRAEREALEKAIAWAHGATMVGFFGTILGMRRALLSTDQDMVEIFGNVGLALITTGVGIIIYLVAFTLDTFLEAPAQDDDGTSPAPGEATNEE